MTALGMTLCAEAMKHTKSHGFKHQWASWGGRAYYTIQDLQPLQADTHHDACIADEQVQGSAALVEAVSKVMDAPQGPQV